jgi:GTPase-activator protein for Ras-like GTPase
MAQQERKEIIRVHLETNAAMRELGLTTGFKTLAVRGSATVGGVKQTLIEKLAKGLENSVAEKVSAECSKCTVTLVNLGSTRRLHDAKCIGELSLGSESKFVLRPMIPDDASSSDCLDDSEELDLGAYGHGHGHGHGHVAGSDLSGSQNARLIDAAGLGAASSPQRSTSPSSGASGGAVSGSGGGSSSTDYGDQDRGVRGRSRPKSRVGKAISKRAKSPKRGLSPSGATATLSVGSLPSSDSDEWARHCRDLCEARSTIVLLQEQMAAVVSVCDELYKEVVEAKRQNVSLRVKLAENAGASSDARAKLAARPIENVELRRSLAKLRRATRDDDPDEDQRMLAVFEQENEEARVKLIISTVMSEIDESEAASTLFRGRSAATKLMSVHLQRAGGDYLQRHVYPLIKLIGDDAHPSLEVNPRQCPDGAELERNRRELTLVTRRVLAQIFEASVAVEIRRLFSFCREQVNTAYPERNMPLRAIAGFFFLRFICPTFVSPRDFQPSLPGRRNLVYVSKLVQNIGNDVEFGDKEAYMKPFNDFLNEQRAPMLAFLESISGLRVSEAHLRLTERPRLSRDDSTIHLLARSNSAHGDLSPRHGRAELSASLTPAGTSSSSSTTTASLTRKRTPSFSIGSASKAAAVAAATTPTPPPSGAGDGSLGQRSSTAPRFQFSIGFGEPAASAAGSTGTATASAGSTGTPLSIARK